MTLDYNFVALWLYVSVPAHLLEHCSLLIVSFDAGGIHLHAMLVLHCRGDIYFTRIIATIC